MVLRLFQIPVYCFHRGLRVRLTAMRSPSLYLQLDRCGVLLDIGIDAVSYTVCILSQTRAPLVS